MRIRDWTCCGLALGCCAGFCADGKIGLERLEYGTEGLVTDLAVGLWAWPLAVDYDGDGDLDLVVSCPDQPYNGLYFFENPTPKGVRDPDPVFLKPVRVGDGVWNIVTASGSGPEASTVLTPDTACRNFRKGERLRWHPLGNLAYTRIHDKPTRVNMRRLADFDGDGRDDLVCGCEDFSAYGTWPWDGDVFAADGAWKNGDVYGCVYVARNAGAENGKVRYDKPAKLALANGASLETEGAPLPMFEDWDGDGDLDLVCGSAVDELTYFENVGTRTAPKYAAGVRLSDDAGRPLVSDLCMMNPSACDWNGDGRMDIVFGEEDGRVGWFENTGRLDGRRPVFKAARYFRQQAQFVKYGALPTIETIDWDGDGDTDILIANDAGRLAFVENLSGPGVARPRWALPKPIPVDGRPFRLMAGRKGSLQGPSERKWGYLAISAGDWDGDGLPDIVMNSITGDVVWFRNVGTRRQPALAAPQDVVVEWEGPQPELAWGWRRPHHKKNPKGLLTQWRSEPCVIDWNGDGLADLVAMDVEGYLCVFERAVRDGARVLLPPKRLIGNGAGAPLKVATGRAGGSGRRKYCFCDWDGDGRRDLLLNNKNAEFWRGIGLKDGVEAFDNSQGDVSGRKLQGHATCPSVVDFDGNGIPDILISAEDGHLYLGINPRINKKETRQ